MFSHIIKLHFKARQIYCMPSSCLSNQTYSPLFYIYFLFYFEIVASFESLRTTQLYVFTFSYTFAFISIFPRKAKPVFCNVSNPSNACPFTRKGKGQTESEDAT